MLISLSRLWGTKSLLLLCCRAQMSSECLCAAFREHTGFSVEMVFNVLLIQNI